MIEELKLEAEFFNLRGLKQELEGPKPPGLDDVIEIDCRGTRIRTTRRVLANGKDHVGKFETLSKMFDPDCE